ncbi:hypothetical protein AVEN_218089-1 [Araneus ventricosus]|uniref:DNA-directed DNA polymerase n=1 Tax=Araneus ventricosus TaxID=182803 RepID=A0A4Y2QS73_ARAVE|nr:hypothetical protein AVEN_218089-1 [Araneus ventricosus]
MNENINVIYDKNVCHICGNTFKKGDIRCRDHYHWSSDGLITGMAHSSCNLNYRATYFIPVVIHNSRNYDTHLILKNLPKNYAKFINIVPINMEKFTVFSLDSLKFLDSYQFLDASLDQLIKNLENSSHEFDIFNTFYACEKNSFLLKRKGVFPYSYLDVIEKLNDTCLPPKEAFFNILNNTPVSDEDYEHAKTVFRTFKCGNLRDYLELYQNVDTIMLAEVFTSFRKTSMQYYRLDPAHFLTSAELTWNAGLKYTKVELELLGDVNDYIFFESQMRGGICYLNKRHVAANNPYIPESYNAKKSHNYIVALDANNLYGFVMSHPLPLGNFSWLTLEEIENFNIFDYDNNSNVGFILEVDLLCPSDMHEKMNDLPLAPEHLTIRYDMLSKYSKTLCDKFGLKHTLPCKKLSPNFYPKTNYITHYLNLKFYLEQGMI